MSFQPIRDAADRQHRGAGAGLTGTASALQTAGISAVPNTVKQLIGQVAASSVDAINTELASPDGLPPGLSSSKASK